MTEGEPHDNGRFLLTGKIPVKKPVSMLLGNIREIPQKTVKKLCKEICFRDSRTTCPVGKGCFRFYFDLMFS